MSITKTHSLYDANEKFWKYYAQSYDLPPNVGNISSALGGAYVTRFKLEHTGDYNDRRVKAVPVNLCSTAVDTLAGSISDIMLTVPDGFEEFVDDVDMQGTSFVQFMADCRVKAAIYGHVFILIDATQASTEILTQADAVAYNIRPYLRLLTPLQVINWTLDASGNLTEVVYKVAAGSVGSILDDSEPLQITEYRYWSNESWKVFQSVDDKTPTLVAEGENQIKTIPISILYHKKSLPMLGTSMLLSASAYQQRLCNTLSQIQSVEERQAFSQATLRSRQTPDELSVGAAVCIHLSPSTPEYGEEKFEWVTPDPAPLALAWDSFFKTVNLAMQSMSLPGDVITAQASAPESGVAKSYDWKNTEKRLITMSINEQEAARVIFSIVSLWLGQDFFEAGGSVVYPTTFDMVSVDQSLKNMISLSVLNPPPTVKRELMRSAVNKLLPRLDQATQEAIDAELEQSVVVSQIVEDLNQG